MQGAKFDDLVADIQAHGLLEPIVLLKGMIIDGRNRYRACIASGAKPAYRTVEFSSEEAAITFVISANLHRRHLSGKEKRAIINKLLKANPERSDRQIAADIGADNKTVASVRTEAEATEEIPHTDKRKGRDGRVRPTGKPPQKTLPEAPSTPYKPEIYLLNDTRYTLAEPEMSLQLEPAVTDVTPPPPKKPASKPKPTPVAEQPSPPKPQGDGPYSPGEHDRLRSLIDKLNAEKRLLEIKVAGLENEVSELKARIGELENAGGDLSSTERVSAKRTDPLENAETCCEPRLPDLR